MEAASFKFARPLKEKSMSFKVGPLSKMKPGASPIADDFLEEGREPVAMAHLETIVAGVQQLAKCSSSESVPLKAESLMQRPDFTPINP